MDEDEDGYVNWANGGWSESCVEPCNCTSPTYQDYVGTEAGGDSNSSTSWNASACALEATTIESKSLSIRFSAVFDTWIVEYEGNTYRINTEAPSFPECNDNLLSLTFYLDGDTANSNDWWGFCADDSLNDAFCDCDGVIVTQANINQYVGDGWCDDGTVNPFYHFNCAKYNFDDGDCE